MSFPELLLNLLKEFNITQAQLSKATGIPTTTINGWIKAGRLPDYNSIKTLCCYFGISADELLQLENISESNLNEEEMKLLRSFKAAPKRTQQAVISILSEINDK
ncbi:MAG: helix-turn-helix domain-containing protein [Clostridia bacterium]|nr:helix-turn-helix domain-containing protein [Clostridia bacterium]